MKVAPALVLLTAVIFSALPLDAPAQPKAKDFYKPDFAKSPLEPQKSTRFPLAGRRTPVGEPSKAPQAADEIGRTNEEKPDAEASSDAAGVDESAPVSNGEFTGHSAPIVSVGVILNTLDKKHALEKLSELSELAVKHDWTIGEIYAVGGLSGILASKPMNMLIVRQARLRAVEELPAKYSKVKLSPAWIIQTPNGQVILEATGPLSTHITPDNQVKY